jgi:hypothetical protein
MNMNFRKWLAEVSHEDLAKIGSAVNMSLKQARRENGDKDSAGLLFDNIFGNKLRIVIPLGEDEIQQNLKYDLESLGYRVDFKTGNAISTIQTQHGTKERSERLGSLIGKLAKKSPEEAEKWKKYLSWWEKNKVGLSKPQSGGVSIIISRSPIDIVRMSDHSEWSSCHSPGNSYYKCAIQEAKTGGAIAYVVRNSDLATVKDLQAKDIFKDRDRYIKGIEPLERLRLRYFSDDDKNIDLLIPDKRVYGTQHVGFVDAVLKWSRHAQRNLVDFKNPPDFSDFDLHGGSYQDTSASTLWNAFFGTDKAVGNKRSVDQDEESEKDEDNAEAMYNQAQQQLEERHFKHWHVYIYEPDGEEGEQLSYSAGVHFSFSKHEFLKPPDEKLASQIGREYYRIIDAPGNLENQELDYRNGSYNFVFDFSGHGDLEDFEHFLDAVATLDDKYDNDRGLVREFLIQAEYLPDWRDHFADQQFDHFSFEWEDNAGGADVTEVKSDLMLIGDLQGLEKERVILDRKISVSGYMSGISFYDRKLGLMDGYLKNSMRMILPPFIKDENILIVSNRIEIMKNMEQGEMYTTPVQVYLQINIPIENADNYRKLIAGVKYLDKNWVFFYQKLYAWFEKFKASIMSHPEPRQQGLALPSVLRRELPPRRPKSTHTQMQLPFPQEEHTLAFSKWFF